MTHMFVALGVGRLSRTLRRAFVAAAGLFLLLLVGLPFLAPRWREWRLRAVPRPLDVLLITLDTTRADRLGCYGAGAGATPNLDRLAREGTLFRRAWAHVPLTCPSHASLLTGLLPPRHGIHDNGGFVLGTGFPTLAELFVDAGYRTAAFVSAFVLDRRFGLARGFAVYEDDMLGPSTATQKERRAMELPAKITVDRALSWLRRPDPRPFFAWVHLYDPHAPYRPPEPYATRFRGHPYEGEIAYMDAEVGRLLTEVARRSREHHPTLVAAIGDHGESLGEHGELTHNYYIYRSTQRVPFLLALPGYLPAGREVQPVVRGVDLMPTLLDVAGLAIPPGLDGHSLVPLLTGADRSEPGPAYLESYHPRLWWGARELLGLRTGRWLYIRSPRPELYDVDDDPGQIRNLAAQNPAELAKLDARLETLVGSTDPLASRSPIDSSTAANLRALGYLGAGAEISPAEPNSLPDAKDNGPLLLGAARGSELADQGRLDEALALFRRTLALNPRSSHVRLKIAETLYSLKRFDEAFAAFKELSQGPADNEHYHLGMALCRLEQGRSVEALAVARQGLQAFPTSPRLLERIGAILLELGRPLEAEEALRQAIRYAPGQLTSRLLLARSLERQARLREAARALREVVDRSPDSSEAREAGSWLADLGATLLAAGGLEDSRASYSAALAAGVSTEAVYLNLGLVCHRLNRRAEALATLQKGVQALPESAAIRYRLGRLLEEEGQARRAAAEYRRALELDPGLGQARAAIARLGEHAR
jgi:choline-sulfatase